MKPESPVCTHLEQNPSFPESVFIAPGAIVMGDVTLGEEASIWYQTVLRADIQSIEIGPGSNIQDGSVVHLASDLGTSIGSYVTCGHKAILHACTVDDEVLIGMGSIVMDGAEIGAQSIIGAGSLVTQGTKVPPGSLVVGSPARVVRALDSAERKSIRSWAEKYISVAREHREFLAKSEMPFASPIY
ncbi:MAG: gamma carbonic anhydrase family protein [Verrucomicrobiales bacterium]|nr:gamma carbonic anhydrase family protein [Verrucomicrobiales bacterium]